MKNIFILILLLLGFSAAASPFVQNSATTNTYPIVDGGGITLNQGSVGNAIYGPIPPNISYGSALFNTIAGYNSMSSLTVGTLNVGFGYNTLAADLNGVGNTALGTEALQLMTGGSQNIAIGYSAGAFLPVNSASNIDIGNLGTANDTNVVRIGTGQTDTYLVGIIHGNGSQLTGISVTSTNVNGTNILGQANNNMMIGTSAGNSTITGLANFGAGISVLPALSSGSLNLAIGSQAGDNLTTGAYNEMLGGGALLTDVSGSNNIAIGYLAGGSILLSSNIDIGNSGLAGDANIIRIGTGQSDTYLTGIIHGNAASLTGLPVGGISASGTASSTTYLRGDGSWQTPSGGGGGNVYSNTPTTFTTLGDGSENVTNTVTINGSATNLTLNGGVLNQIAGSGTPTNTFASPVNMAGGGYAASITTPTLNATVVNGNGVGLTNLQGAAFSITNSLATAVTNVALNIGTSPTVYLNTGTNVCFNSITGTFGVANVLIGGAVQVLWPTNCPTSYSSSLSVVGTNYMLQGTNNTEVQFNAVTNLANNPSLTNVWVTWLTIR